jgi:SnoaL-like protein
VGQGLKLPEGERPSPWLVAPMGLSVVHRPVMDLERNKAVVREFDELGNGTGDLGRLEELCTPDMVNHALAPGRAAGLAGTREFLQARHRRGRPARWIESHVVAEGDLVVQSGRREDLSAGGAFRGSTFPPASTPETPPSPTGSWAGASLSGGQSATTWP